METIEEVVKVLRGVRISRRMDEDGIHVEIMAAFDRNHIVYEHEYKLIAHKRFDFWLDGIVVEVKKRKPSKISLLNQLNRYTMEPGIRAIIVVMEEAMVLPRVLNQKPIRIVSLNANWGIAL